MPLPPEDEAWYSAIIDRLLANSDLNTVSAKSIRKGLQKEIDHDITPQKKEINDLIHARFDKVNSERQNAARTEDPAEPAPTAASPTTNGAASASAKASTPQSEQSSSKKRDEPDDESDLSEVVDSPPPKKKSKKNSHVESDAALAARLQAEENGRARSTRGGGASRRRPPVKKAAPKKKKSATKVKSDDDSELGSGSDAEKPKKRGGGFHKPMTLSAPLSELLGETQLSRPQTVKKIWEYIKANGLQDPTDKRQIRCDDAMRAVFKTDKVHMFTMNKILNQNLYAQDE